MLHPYNDGDYNMAHMIEYANGKHSFAYTGQPAWHGLGSELPANCTPEEMMIAAGLDWTVRVEPTFIEVNGEKIVTSSPALVRDSDNRILDIISNDWKPIQNHEAFEFFAEFVESGEMNMSAAGSLYDGKHVWATANVSDGFTLGNGDEVEGYLLFSSPHQYGKSLDVRFVAERVVCHNTLSIALGEKSKQFVKLNHRRKFDADEVKKMMNITSINLHKFEEQAQFLTTKKIKGEDIVEYFNRVFPATSKAEDAKESLAARRCVEILEQQPGADMFPGTFWNAFNAVTFNVDHLQGRDQNARVQSSWYGAGADRKVDALRIALEMAA